MTPTAPLAGLLERFFPQRLLQQRQVSPHTVRSYRDTFRLLLRYAAFEEPAHAAQISRVRASPGKRHTRRLVTFLTRPEIAAVLAAPDLHTWFGRRDHALLLVAVQPGLRVSELTGLQRGDVALGVGAHVRCVGKGRKERCTPLTKTAVAVLTAWLREPPRHQAASLFPNARGGRLSPDAVADLRTKHAARAGQACPSLGSKRVTPHVLRHTMALELLQAGVDRAVIALWLGHESVETTQIYLEANLALKEAILAKTTPLDAQPGRSHAGDVLLAFLNQV